jgi:hypothetical protein
MWQSKKLRLLGTALRREVTTGGPIVMLGTSVSLQIQHPTEMTVHDVYVKPVCSKIYHLGFISTVRLRLRIGTLLQSEARLAKSPDKAQSWNRNGSIPARMEGAIFASNPIFFWINVNRIPFLLVEEV